MSRARRGFTLIEILISSALALALAGLCVEGFLGVRRAIDRAEARIAMHAAAQTLYTALRNAVSGIQQSCAVVVRTTQSTGANPEPGAVSILFMRAKEDTDDFAAWQPINSQLVWEQWAWSQQSRTLSVATSRNPQRSANDRLVREFTIAGSFIPDAASGVDFKTQTFQSLAQPRRALTVRDAHNGATVDPTGPPDPLHPEYSTLGDNIYFPDPAQPGKSLVSEEDLGDYEDLKRALVPVLAQVSDFSLQVVHHDPTYATADGTTTNGVTTLATDRTRTIVWNGVWLDGRLGATGDRATVPLAPPQVFEDTDLTDDPAVTTSSDVAKRPRLLRVRFTLTDDHRQLSQTFSFSFAWPGMAGSP